MTKIIVYLTKCIVIMITILLLASCKTNWDFGDGVKGSGNVTTQTRTATDIFSKIKVQQGIIVEVTQADNQNIEVKADDNLQNLIETKIANGVLTVSSKESYNTNSTPVVKVSLKIIESLTASSGSSINSMAMLSSTNLDITTSSGSSIRVDVQADNLSLDASSGSTIETIGKALKLETSASSGSSIDAKKLLANDVFAQASSGSTTNVSPIVSLDAKSSSGASIGYQKSPKSLKVSESSGGSISQK